MNPNDKACDVYRAGRREGERYMELLAGLGDTLIDWDCWAGCADPYMHLGHLLNGNFGAEGYRWVSMQTDRCQWWLAYPCRYAARRDYAGAAADACRAWSEQGRQGGS